MYIYMCIYIYLFILYVIVGSIALTRDRSLGVLPWERSLSHWTTRETPNLLFFNRSPAGLGLTLMTSFNLNYLFKGPINK